MAAPKDGNSDSLSFFLLVAGYLLLVIATLIALRFVVFDLWLGTAPASGGLPVYAFGLLLVPVAMITAGHLLRRK